MASNTGRKPNGSKKATPLGMLHLHLVATRYSVECACKDLSTNPPDVEATLAMIDLAQNQLRTITAGLTRIQANKK